MIPAETEVGEVMVWLVRTALLSIVESDQIESIALYLCIKYRFMRGRCIRTESMGELPACLLHPQLLRKPRLVISNNIKVCVGVCVSVCMFVGFYFCVSTIIRLKALDAFVSE